MAKAICAIAWAAKKIWWLLVISAYANAPVAPMSTKILQRQNQYKIILKFFWQNLESKIKQGRHTIYV